MKTVVESTLVESVMQEMDVAHFEDLSIRQLVSLVDTLEKTTGEEFIHFEIGVPGLPPSSVGVEAHKAALDQGVSCIYPPLEGIPSLKEATSRFIKRVIGADIDPRCCVPTVGSMQGVFAAMMLCANIDPKKDTVLFLDPGFSVQKGQADVIGMRRESFDIFNYRAEKLGPKLEEYLQSGRIAAIIYSTPNNPTWMCLAESELETIGKLATKYDAIVFEDLAYITMDFRAKPQEGFYLPRQASVTNYTDNYILFMSGSKIFSYAGERIAVACISPVLFDRRYEHLRGKFGLAGFGNVFIQRLIYTLSSGVSYSAQCALAAMFDKAASGDYNYLEEVVEYAHRTARLREILTAHGLNLVYDKDIDQPVGNGFFFTIGYKDMTGAQLLEKLLLCGISGIVLSTTGAAYEGIRACSSAIKPHHYDLLDQRLAMFEELVANQ